MSQFFTLGGRSIGVSALAMVFPMNIQDWFPLRWTGWISLQSKGLSRVFSNTILQKHQFFSAQLSFSEHWPELSWVMRPYLKYSRNVLLAFSKEIVYGVFYIENKFDTTNNNPVSRKTGRNKWFRNLPLPRFYNHWESMTGRMEKGLPWWFSGKESICQCRRLGFNPWVERSHGGGNGNPLQYACLRNSMDRGAWQAVDHGVAKSQTWFSD